VIRYSKGTEPRCLAIYRSTPGAAWPPEGQDSAKIRGALIRDQSALCAYCQRRIENFKPAIPPPEDRRMRIEHWSARSIGGAPFVWNNLLGCCSGRSGPHPSEGEAASPTDHCDRVRGNTALFLQPVGGLGTDPEVFLRYNGDGTMVAHDDRAEADIRTLNLNCAPLVRTRTAVLDGLRAKLGDGPASVSTLQNLMSKHVRRSGEPALECTDMVRYFVKRWLKKRHAGS
jgi:uncharacterized protein (TIGR02646 family)